MAKCAFCSARLTPVDGRCRYCGMARSGPSAAWGVPEWASPVELQPVTRGRQAVWLMSSAAVVAVASVVLYLNGAFGSAPGTVVRSANAAKVADGIASDPLADPGSATVAVMVEQVAALHSSAAALTASNLRSRAGTRGADAVSYDLAPATLEATSAGVRFTEPTRFAMQLPSTPTVKRFGNGKLELQAAAGGVSVQFGALPIPEHARPSDALILKAGVDGLARRVQDLRVIAVKSGWEYSGIVGGAAVRGRLQVSPSSLLVTEVTLASTLSPKAASKAFDRYGASLQPLG